MSDIMYINAIGVSDFWNTTPVGGGQRRSASIGMADAVLSTVAKGAETQTQQGSCLCGTVKYTISGPPSTTVLCHCISCKKASGSSFMANGFYEKSVC